MANDHMDYIEGVAREDIAALREKESTYRGSWKKRGGVGAFMMLARKWDRLETILNCDNITYDVFKAIEMSASGVDGSALAEVRDLRRYLLLVESEMVARGVLRPINKNQELHVTITNTPRAGESAEQTNARARDRLDLWSTPQLRAQLQDLGRSPASPVGDALMSAIRVELERRERKTREEITVPGSPEDGGHHEPRDPIELKIGTRVVVNCPGHPHHGRAGVARYSQAGDAYVQLDRNNFYTALKRVHLRKEHG